MILKEREYKKCPTCGHNEKMIHDEIFGCDTCKKVIDLNYPEKEYLDVTVHYKEKRSEALHFCSWKCCIKKLSKVKTDYFISLPLLSYDQGLKSGMSHKAFFKLFDKSKLK